MHFGDGCKPMVTARLSDPFGRGAAALRLCIGRHQSDQDVAPPRPSIRVLLGKRGRLNRDSVTTRLRRPLLRWEWTGAGGR
jgi:hypothetical protein